MKVLLRATVGGRRGFGLGLAIACMVLGLDGREASAEAIHHRVAQPAAVAFRGMPAAEVLTFRSWSRYLLAGPRGWSTVEHPAVTPAVRSAIWVSVRTNPGPADPMVNFLLWKQSIDPTRFARYHPHLAPALRRVAMSRTLTPIAVAPFGPPSIWGTTGVSATPTTTSTTTTPPTKTAQDRLYPPAVPEPGMILIAAGMTAWFVRRFHFRSR